MPRKYTTLERVSAFWDKVEFTDTCWLWTAARAGRGIPYGHFSSTARAGVYAHRWAYEFCVGPIPAGLQIDHLCRVRLCVRPDHLEPVTRRENILRGESFSAREARQTHCKRSHEFDAENTYTQPSGGRMCRACARASYHAKKLAIF